MPGQVEVLCQWQRFDNHCNRSKNLTCNHDNSVITFFFFYCYCLTYNLASCKKENNLKKLQRCSALTHLHKYKMCLKLWAQCNLLKHMLSLIFHFFPHPQAGFEITTAYKQINCLIQFNLLYLLRCIYLSPTWRNSNTFVWKCCFVSSPSSPSFS